MKLLRPSLPKHVKSSRDVLSVRAGTHVSVAGLVTCRQRPGTASGVVFVTLEDELGFLNIVLWARTFEKFHHVASSSRLLVVHGKLERSVPDAERGGRPTLGARTTEVPQSVIHVIAERLESLDSSLPRLAAMSRDFH